MTGAGGMLGSAVVERALVLGHDVHGATHAQLDVTDAGAVQRVLHEICPAAVVHCAAYTDVDGAESAWSLAEAVNVRGAGNVAAAAQEVGARIVHLSTDYVFDGFKREPWVESDPVGPLGVYMFTAGIHDAARAIEPSARGELEITDAIQYLVDDGRRVEPHIVRGWWKDTGRLEDMLEANRLVLDRIEPRVEGDLVESQCDGRVVVEPGARLERTTVRGPAIIGAGAVIRDAYIGPYTAIGDNCVIDSAEVEHSILLEGSSLAHLDHRTESSLLGKNVKISRGDRQPRAYRFMVGDNSEIGIL